MLWKKQINKKLHDVLYFKNQKIRRFCLLPMYIKDYAMLQDVQYDPIMAQWQKTYLHFWMLH